MSQGPVAPIGLGTRRAGVSPVSVRAELGNQDSFQCSSQKPDSLGTPGQPQLWASDGSLGTRTGEDTGICKLSLLRCCWAGADSVGRLKWSPGPPAARRGAVLSGPSQSSSPGYSRRASSEQRQHLRKHNAYTKM